MLRTWKIKDEMDNKTCTSVITTSAEHRPMSFQTLSNKTLKILLPILVFWMSRNRYFVQKEGLRKRESEEVCWFSK